MTPDTDTPTLQTRALTLYRRAFFLYRLALGLLILTVLLLSAGYARLRTDNRQLAADAQWQRDTVEALGQTQDVYAAKIAELQAENARLRAENKDIFQGLEMTRKSGKSRERLVRRVVLPREVEKLEPIGLSR